jgi:hypothetical protein
LGADIREEVQKQTFSGGGILIEELVRWSKNRGDDPENFYQELRTAIELGELMLEGAALVAPSL